MFPARSIKPESSESCCLVVMETGSRWPTWLEAPPASRIVVQDPLESSQALTTRSLRVIDALRVKGQRLHALVIAAGRGNPGGDPLGARSEVARAALATLAPGAGVVLAGSEDLPEAARHELFATAEAIAQLLAGSASSVCVRFDAPDSAERHPISGIYPVVKLAPAKPVRADRTGTA
jgi:hypothetical protein